MYHPYIPELNDASAAVPPQTPPPRAASEKDGANRKKAGVEQQYLEEQILNASPGQLLLMLYDGAIKNVLIAKKAIGEKDYETSNNKLIRAQKIIMEFMDTLDFNVYPEMAQNLLGIYEYMHYQLVQANIKRDVALLDEVLWHLKNLRKTWNEALVNAASEGGTAEASLQLPSLAPAPSAGYHAPRHPVDTPPAVDGGSKEYLV
jgi:flagellar secretion chaperone FliS